jgi:hypothetical protein
VTDTVSCESAVQSVPNFNVVGKNSLPSVEYRGATETKTALLGLHQLDSGACCTSVHSSNAEVHTVSSAVSKINADACRMQSAPEINSNRSCSITPEFHHNSVKAFAVQSMSSQFHVETPVLHNVHSDSGCLRSSICSQNASNQATLSVSKVHTTSSQLSWNRPQTQAVPVQHVEQNDSAYSDILKMALAQSGIYSNDAPALSMPNDVSNVITSSVQSSDTRDVNAQLSPIHSTENAESIKSVQSCNSSSLADHFNSHVLLLSATLSCSECSRQSLPNASCLSSNKLQPGHNSDAVGRNCSSTLPGHCILSSSHIQFAPSYFVDCSRVASPSQSFINKITSQNCTVDPSNCVPVVGSTSVVCSINEPSTSIQSIASHSRLGNTLSYSKSNTVIENINQYALSTSSTCPTATDTIRQQPESAVNGEAATVVKVTLKDLPSSDSSVQCHLSTAECCASLSSSHCKKRDISSLTGEKLSKKRVSIVF